MNTIIIMGRLGKDVALHTTQTGKSVASLRVAVPRILTKEAKAQGAQDTDWFDVIAWGKVAEFAAKYLSKGRQILVGGRLQTRSYEKDGKKFTRTEIVAETIEFADSKPQQVATPQGGQAAQVTPITPADPQGFGTSADEIPF